MPASAPTPQSQAAAIRAAAADILCGTAHTRITLAVRRWGGAAESVSVAGLDVGWGQQVPMALDHWWRYSVTRHLPAGTFQFKVGPGAAAWVALAPSPCALDPAPKHLLPPAATRLRLPMCPAISLHHHPTPSLTSSLLWMGDGPTRSTTPQ